MARTQNPLSLHRTTILVTLLLIAITASAQDPSWTTITSSAHPGEMLSHGDYLYLATSGGLLITEGPDDPGLGYVNTDGLGTSELTDVIVAEDGQVWLTGKGYIIRFDPQNPLSYPVFDNEGKLVELTCLVDDGDYLWVGSDRGLILFDKHTDGGQIHDSYGFFGSLNPNPRVNDILLTPDSIWVATSVGLATARRTNPTALKAPAAWTSFEPPEPQYPRFLRITRFEDKTYAGTENGFFELRRPPAYPDTTFVELPVPQWLAYVDLEIVQDTLWFYFSESRGLYGGYGMLHDGQTTLLDITGLPHPPAAGTVHNGIRWMSPVRGRIYYSWPGGFRLWPHYGPPGNTISDLVVDNNSVVYAGFDRLNVVGRSGVTWNRLDVFGAWTTVGMLDSLQRAWIGTYGGGAYLFDADSVIRFDTTNSSLTGNDQGLNYVVINGMNTDGQYLYFACYRAYTDNPIAYVPADRVLDPDAWDSFGIAEGITSDRPTGIAVYGPLVAMGTESNGVFLCNVGPDPFDKSDIECLHLTRENSLLISNTTTDIAFSPDGVLWVGTNRGLSWYDNGIDRFIEIPLPEGTGPEVRDLAFDNRGNLWIATPGGVLRHDHSTGDFTVLTTFNSGLVSNDVNSVFYHTPTGDVWFATAAGISVRSSEIGPPAQQLEQVTAFPNPYVISAGDQPLQFNYAFPATVRIFTPAGEKVDEFPVNRPWYGRNQRGEELASGVYIFILRDQQGEVGRGKFVLVRN
jgi:streptogramin lyase